MFPINETSRGQTLLVRVAAHTCALDLAQVVEIMRPLPIERVAGAPDLVRGLAVIRGVPVPVVGQAGLFNTGAGGTTRFVVVRAGERQVALAVDAVVELAPSVYQAMPPLLRDAAMGAVNAIAALDSQLYFVLNTASIVPDERLLSPVVPEG